MRVGDLSIEAVRRVVADVMEPRHFQVREPLELEWSHTSHESIPWELFRGQLVQSHLTRETRKFESWNVHGRDELGRSEEPLLSIKLDHSAGEIHVVRAILCHVWEGYDSGGGVYLSREVQRWVRELFGTVKISSLSDEAALGRELSSLLFHAVVGMSRLPLTSLESPMPGWSLGRLAYFPAPLRSLTVAARQSEVAARQSRNLEWMIRSSALNQMPDIARNFQSASSQLGATSNDTCRLFRGMFNEISLSPYTDFVDKSLEFMRLLVARQHLSIEQQIDLLGWLLRQLARHLTAYDLVTFHHRGANYPDALLLDAVLKEYLQLIEKHPNLFEGDDSACRKRRRALRLGWLHRRRYEGHPVPDAPTSSGENARVLPPPHVRVPEEQIVNPAKRKKRLYENDPLPNHVGPNARRVLQVCGRDLLDTRELRELGMAIFIERPLSGSQPPGMPDSSPLLAHEAYSRSLAERALRELAIDPLLNMTGEDETKSLAILDEAGPTSGIAAIDLPANPQRVVSLADAAKAAKDFVITRTLPGSVRAFASWRNVAGVLRDRGLDLNSGRDWLIVGSDLPNGKPGILIRDAAGTSVAQIEVSDLHRMGATNHS